MSSQSAEKIAPEQRVRAEDTPRRQFAALCWRMHGGKPEVLLITSRDTGRWILPKGWPMEGRSPAGAAAREAWEEAGVEGEVADTSIGSYSYDKVLRRAAALPCEVQVYPLRVDRLTDKYPERRQRRRKWFSLAKAARKVNEPELRLLLAGFGGDEAQAVEPGAVAASVGVGSGAAPAGETRSPDLTPDRE